MSYRVHPIIVAMESLMPAQNGVIDKPFFGNMKVQTIKSQVSAGLALAICEDLRNCFEELGRPLPLL
jgi:hypothetical protein